MTTEFVMSLLRPRRPRRAGHRDRTCAACVAGASPRLILLGFGLLYSLAGTADRPPAVPAPGHRQHRSNSDGKVVGSALVAQPFTDARYFQPRPSAAELRPDGRGRQQPARSNPDLRKRIDEAGAAVADARRHRRRRTVPGELVTAVRLAAWTRTSRRRRRRCRSRAWRSARGTGRRRARRGAGRARTRRAAVRRAGPAPRQRAAS